MSETGIRDVFLAEAREILESLESDIVQLEESGGNQDIINRIFRYIHTLKGSSGIAGINRVYEFTHRLENLLDDVRAGKLSVDDRIIDLILKSIDWVQNELYCETLDIEKSDEKKGALLLQIDEFMGTGKADQVKQPASELKLPQKIIYPGSNYYNVRAVFKQDIFEFGIDPLMIIEDLAASGDVVSRKVLKSRLPKFSDLDPEKCYIGWEFVIKTDKPMSKIRDVFLFVMDDNEITIEDVTQNYSEPADDPDIEIYEGKKLGEIMVEKNIISEKDLESVINLQDSKNEKLGDIIIKKGLASEKDVNEALKDQEKIKKKLEFSTIRVDTNKLDNLMNLLGEIVIGQSALSGIAEEMDDESAFLLKNALYALDRTTREFQEQIMGIRMIPVGPTFEQFRRFVRDSAHNVQKEIRLVIEGGDTELDKTVIERINDPLKHMIRNSIDHGIEIPEERIKAGKDPAGTVILRAYHQEGNVFIEVADDGKGVSLAKVREKGIKQGLVRPEEDIGKDKLLSLLFLPGFSTASAIGDLSGRGVGMDVVKTNIEELRGTVQLKSEEGNGTVVKIKLPLTLAIIDGMLVSSGKNIYIVPLLSVVESIQPKKEDVRTVEGKGEVILVRGEYVSLIRLYDLFGIEAKQTDPSQALVVIVESANTRVGLMVDDLIGQQQIVIKSLENYITRSRAVSGAAILGDGKVALIIDIHGLISELE